MNTCQLQYLHNGNWKQLLSDDGFPIEFLSKSAATSIAALLSNLPDFPTINQFDSSIPSWLIYYSNGIKDQLFY